MVEQSRKIEERVGHYPVIGGDTSESTRQDFPLEVQERMIRLALEGKSSMIEATTVVDQNGKTVLEVTERYYDNNPSSSE